MKDFEQTSRVIAEAVQGADASEPTGQTPSGRVGYDGAATFLGVKVGTLRSMVSRGQVPHIRLSARLVVFDLHDLAAHLESHKVGAR